MIDLKVLLKGKGLISFDDLLTYCKPESAAELFEMVENREVSAHTEPMGGINYRYPYYSAKVKAPETSKASLLLNLIKDNPGLNAAVIKETLGISQSSFDRWEKELLENGRIVQRRSGKSWLYYSMEEVPSKSGMKSQNAVWRVFVEHWYKPHWSIQKLAERLSMSRESVGEGKKWLEEGGVLEKGELVGFIQMSPIERREWLRKSFTRDYLESYIKSEESSYTVDQIIEIYCETPKRAGGVLQSPPLAQLVELDRLILEAMEGGFEWTVKALMSKIPKEFHHANEDGGIINPVVKRLIQLAKDGLVIREWDGDDSTPALYSLPEKRV